MAETSSAAPVASGHQGWRDLLASVVVFLVALPLCIGIARACGLPPESGLVSGIVGGLLVGALSGSPLQVSGPAAGLIVLVIQVLDEATAAGYTGPAAVVFLGVAVFLAGLVQILAGMLRLGQWFRAVSPAVVGGMLAGIGTTIIAKQFHEMVDDTPPKEVIDGLLTIPAAVWKGVAPPEGTTADHPAAAAIGLLTILILASWKVLAPRRLRLLPAAVVAVAVAVTVTEAAGLTIHRVRLQADLADMFTPIAWPGWDLLRQPLLGKAVLTLALIASAETLLCAVAVDSLHTGPRTRFNRELVAQGFGNAVCGLLGALPVTGVIVRSAANIEAGARTRLATILHGVWLLLFVALLPGLLSRIPDSALAAVLVYTGWKLINLPGLRRLWRIGAGELATYLVTAAAIVTLDLLQGVLSGMTLALARLLWAVTPGRLSWTFDPARRRIDCFLEGAATFLRLPLIADRLEAIPPGHHLHVHLDRLQFVDHACLELLMNFQWQYEATGGTVFLDWELLRARFRAQPTPPRPPAEPQPAPDRTGPDPTRPDPTRSDPATTTADVPNH